MNILILGANGQVGSEIADKLYERFKVKNSNTLKIYKLCRKDVDFLDFEKAKEHSIRKISSCNNKCRSIY